MLKRGACLLALAHLLVVAATIAHGSDAWLRRGFWVRPLVLYSGLSYAIWRFGFFAPDVGKSTELEVVVHGRGGDTRRYSTLEGFHFFTANREAMNRFYAFKLLCAREDLHDLCARSVATRLLNLHTNAVTVDYATRSIRWPAMDDYLAGAPVRKVEYYSTTFVLRDPAAGTP